LAESAVEVRLAHAPLLSETREVPFAPPKALPAEEEKTSPPAPVQAAPAKKANLAPGVIPKALPVEMPPKGAKAHR
jgi:hypothetical protein